MFRADWATSFSSAISSPSDASSSPALPIPTMFLAPGPTSVFPNANAASAGSANAMKESRESGGGPGAVR